MEVLANTEYQDVYRITDGVLLVVNKFLYKDYSKKTKRIIGVNNTGRDNCKTYNKGCQSCLKELKRDYLDTYATVAALNTDKNYICFEKDKDTFEVGSRRVAEYANQDLLISAT